MKKVLMKILIGLFSVSIFVCGCGDNKDYAIKKDNKISDSNQNINSNNNDVNVIYYDMTEFDGTDKILLEANFCCCGLLDYNSECWLSTKYTIYYDGTVKTTANYTLSGVNTYKDTKLSEEDYRKVCEFVAYFNAGKYDNCNVDACDGDTWRFATYNDDGTLKHDFDGYTYGYEAYEDIQSVIRSYIGDFVSQEKYYPRVTGDVLNIGQGSTSIAPADFDNSVYQFYYNLWTNSVMNSDDDSNLLISPVSAECVLNMIAAGSESETLSELIELYMSGATKTELVSHLDNICNYNYIEGNSVVIRNSLWADDDRLSEEGLELNEEYLNLLRLYFSARCERIPFDDKGIETINNYISDSTNGMIDKFLDGPSECPLLFINTINFDGKWDVSYKPEDIKEDGVFVNSKGQKEHATMMHSTENIYYSSDIAVGFSKEYIGSNYSFIAILPNDKNIDMKEFVKEFEGDKMNEFILSRSEEDVNVYMPSIKMETKTDLTSSLNDMGITKLFDNPDFSDMFTSDSASLDCSLGIIVQKACIDINEEGTKAAAVTGNEKGIDMENLDNYVWLDRPYMFIIYDNYNNMPLFMGLVNSVEE